MASGGLAALGQAPFDLWVLGFIGFVGVAVAVGMAPKARRAAFLAWVAGSVHFAVALHWIVEPFFVDPVRHGWMAPFAILFLSTGLALFWGLAGGLSARLAPVSSLSRALVFGACLALAEYLRGTILTGFPWAQPGHILIDTGLLRLAPMVGPIGLTALVLMAASLMAGLLLRHGSRVAGVVFVPVLAAGFLVPPGAPMTPTEGAPIIRLIQPNAPQHLKWQPEMIPVFFERGLDLTAQAPDPTLGAPDLIIWPETSLPELLNQSDLSRSLIAEAAGGVPVIVGAQRFEGISGRNTLAVLGPTGEITALYDKHHLVPFGEYLPFRELFAWFDIRALAQILNGGYRPGPGPAALDLGELGQAFAMICYEAIFPRYIAQVERPDWMVHITNDAWFGEFSGPYQHLALARLRAAEQGLPLVRAANTGISAVIDGRGQITASLPLGVDGALDAALPPALPPTLYARTGDWPALAALLILLGGALGLSRRNRH